MIGKKCGISPTVRNVFIGCLFMLVLNSCAYDPRQVDIPLKTEPPLPKTTSFDKILSDLGIMTEVYSTYKLKIQSIDIGDNTGTSKSTQYEIPQNISEMIVSSLNSIGGNIVYIPYLPNYIYNMQNVGYSNFPNKMIPDAILTGGITEFDRGLETRGRNTDLSAETKDITDALDLFDSEQVGGEYSDAEKSSIARITLDFNLIDYQTLSGIPRMQTVNTISVHKATKEKEVGFNLFGAAFGLKGTVKKVQGRHAAIRLLVQLNIIQVIGKFYDLPYWTLLPDARPDPVVIDTLSADFYQMNPLKKIIKTQELLFIKGYDAPLTGSLDARTIAALKDFDGSYIPTEEIIDIDRYLNLYTSLPITRQSAARKKQFEMHLQQFIQALQNANAKTQGGEPE